jgi:hypothetical protein
MAAYGVAVWSTNPPDRWRPVIAGVLALALVQVAYPTKSGWFLSLTILAGICLMSWLDPFRNMGPDHLIGALIFWAFAVLVFKYCRPDAQADSDKRMS